MRFSHLVSHGPLRTLVWRSFIVSVVPLVILSVAALKVSTNLIERRFEQEATVVARTAENAIAEKANLTTRAALLVAALPTTRELIEGGDSEKLTDFLLPMKSRLGVDIMNVARPDGEIVARAQDNRGGTATLPPLLVRRAEAASTQTWALFDQPQGLTLRAIALVRGQDGSPVGIIEVGMLLERPFLNGIKANSNVELMLSWDGAIRASTIEWGTQMPPQFDEVDDSLNDRMTRVIDFSGTHYFGIFTVMRSQNNDPGILGVLVPRSPVEQTTKSLLTILAALVVVMSVVIIVLSYRLGQTITEPLRRLTRAAERIQAGEHSARVEQKSKNELRTLELAFNGMAESLQGFSQGLESMVRQRTVRLDALHSLGTQLSAASSLQQIAQLPADAAQLVVRVVDVDFAAVLELRADDQRLLLSATAGTSAGSSADGRHAGEVVAGPDSPTSLALVTLEPVIIEDIALDDRFSSLDEFAPGAVSGVAVVIPQLDRPFGVLSAYSSKPREFDEEDVAFLQSIANALGQTTQRIRATDELRREHARTEHLLTSISSVLVGVDAGGEVSVWNQAAHEIFQVSPADMMGRPFTQQPLGWRWDHVGRAIAECQESGRPVRVDDVLCIRPDGSDVYLSLEVNPITDDRGRQSGYLLIGVDVTERRALEGQLVQAQRLEAIGRLAAGIAHEINTPTQYVGDNVRFLAEAFSDVEGLLAKYGELIEANTAAAPAENAEDAPDLEFLMAEIPQAIQQSLEGVERVAEIVRAVKEFSHPGSGAKTPIDLNRAIESTVTVARNEWKYVANVTMDLDPSLPLVPCLPGEFNQAVLNIVINAAHAIEDLVGPNSDTRGTITVSTRHVDDWAEVRIADSGTGIPDEIKGRIFDPFYTTKGVGRGTGQGLAIARSVIVDKHAGTLSFESAAGVGTTFIIRLPLVAAAAIAA